MKLSMVEIYRERIRDLLDISKDNLQIRYGKFQGVYLAGVTEIPILDPAEALICIFVRHLKQNSMGGNSRTALLCCCSPSASNAIESMSTLRFGTRLNL